MPNIDWQSRVLADDLYKLERDGFAWECLRRNPTYRKDFDVLRHVPSTAAGKTAAARLATWGLSFRVRPGASGRPGSRVLAAGVRAHGRHSRTVTARIPQHRQT